MNADKIARLNPSPIIAACIIAAGLVTAAAVDSHKIPGQAAGAVEAQPLAPGTPSEASIHEQFMSQINTQYSGRTEMLFGKEQTCNSISIDKIQIATKGDKINIVYEIHWKSDNATTDATTGTGCLLIKDDYGHFTNTDVVYADQDTIHPRLDIQ